MKDTDLYSRILGLSAPWFVADVELDTTVGQVDVHVDHAPVSDGDVRPVDAIWLAGIMPSPGFGVTSTPASSRPFSMPGFHAWSVLSTVCFRSKCLGLRPKDASPCSWSV